MIFADDKRKFKAVLIRGLEYEHLAFVFMHFDKVGNLQNSDLLILGKMINTSL